VHVVTPLNADRLLVNEYMGTCEATLVRFDFQVLLPSICVHVFISISSVKTIDWYKDESDWLARKFDTTEAQQSLRHTLSDFSC